MKRKITILSILTFITVISFAQVNPNYHYVEGYFRKDGTYVRGHYKTNSNYTNRDNYTTKSNVNPWTGKPGYIEPDKNYLPDYAHYNTPEILSSKYNEALSLNDKRNYRESISVCMELISEYDKPFHTTYLIGWNFIGLGDYEAAVKAFEMLESLHKNSYLTASPLFVAYKLNNDINAAKRIEQKMSFEYDNNEKFKESVTEIVREIHLNYGIPNLNILELILDTRDVYLDVSLLEAMSNCRDCKLEIFHPKIIDIGEGALKKRIYLKEELVGPVNAVEFLMEKSKIGLLQKVLIKLGFEYRGNIETPILIVKEDGRMSSTESEIYVKSDYGVMLSDVDLDGEYNVNYFKITIRK